MNYEPNTINWKVGDLVIHDADEKAERMLMKVITIFENGRIGTEYLTREGTQPIYPNPKEVLHDPARFGIRTTNAIRNRHDLPAHKLTWWTCRICNRVRAYTETDLQEMPGRRPVCKRCDDGVRRFLQKIKFSED